MNKTNTKLNSKILLNLKSDSKERESIEVVKKEVKVKLHTTMRDTENRIFFLSYLPAELYASLQFKNNRYKSSKIGTN